jgi:predicted DNA-binding transcriptional regulator AlpA
MPEPGARYLTMPDLCARWSCSHMLIERRLRDDPQFPKPVRFGPSAYAHRRFLIDDIEAYERACAVAARPAPQELERRRSARSRNR